jgi:hypothetical protein
MRNLMFIVLALTAACDRADRDDRGTVEVRKPVETPAPAPTVEQRHFDLQAEREKLSREIEERTAQLDARIDELEKRADEKSRDAAALLRAKRDQARAKLGDLETRTEDTWAAFKRDVQSAWDQLERDVREATR